MPRERPEEDEAAVAVAETIGGTIVQRDVPGAPERTHDFDIVIDSLVVALEVTSAADEDVTALWEALGRSEWLEPSLSRSWGITLAPGARIKKLRKRLAGALSVLEGADVRRFGFGHPGGPQADTVREALSTLEGLGVRGGIAVDDSPTRIVIGTAGTGSSEWAGRDSISEAVEREAAANAEKLARATADERHLFVWIDWTMPDLQAAVIGVLRLGIMPRVPELPEGVDTAWVAPRAMVDETQTFLWRMTPPGDWEVLDPSVLRGGQRRTRVVFGNL